MPIITIWFGYGLQSRLIATVLIAIFPVITNTFFGLMSADRQHHDLFTLNKASRLTRLWKMELPGAMPAIFTGLRIAAGGAVIGAIVEPHGMLLRDTKVWNGTSAASHARRNSAAVADEVA